jgi:hypothetical protein
MLAWQEPERRAEASAWVRPGTDALLAGIWATRRALDEDPAGAEALVRGTVHGIDSLDLLWIEARSFGPGERLLGWPPATPAGHSLLAALLRAMIRARDRVPARDPALLAACRRALEGAAVAPAEPGARDDAALAELARAHREPMLRIDDSAVADFLAVLLRAWVAGRLPPPTLDQVSTLVGWIDAHPGELGNPKARAALAADLDRLLGGL